jgi:hypothetical protein
MGVLGSLTNGGQGIDHMHVGLAQTQDPEPDVLRASTSSLFMTSTYLSSPCSFSQFAEKISAQAEKPTANFPKTWESCFGSAKHWYVCDGRNHRRDDSVFTDLSCGMRSGIAPAFSSRPVEDLGLWQDLQTVKTMLLPLPHAEHFHTFPRLLQIWHLDLSLGFSLKPHSQVQKWEGMDSDEHISKEISDFCLE